MYILGAVLILSWWRQQNSLLCVCVYTEDVPIEFMSLVFTHMTGESYCRQLLSFLLCSCSIFQVLINSLVCWQRCFLHTHTHTHMCARTHTHKLPLSHIHMQAHKCPINWIIKNTRGHWKLSFIKYQVKIIQESTYTKKKKQKKMQHIYIQYIN